MFRINRDEVAPRPTCASSQVLQGRRTHKIHVAYTVWSAATELLVGTRRRGPSTPSRLLQGESIQPEFARHKRFGAQRHKKKTFLPGRGRKAESPQWIQLSSRLKSRRSCRLNNKLFRLRGSIHSRGGRLSVGDGLCHFIKISSADKPLVPDCGITFVRTLEFFLLEP
jgi:hypothetical protein